MKRQTQKYSSRAFMFWKHSHIKADDRYWFKEHISTTSAWAKGVFTKVS